MRKNYITFILAILFMVANGCSSQEDLDAMLFDAVSNSSKEVVSKLISKGANIGAQNQFGSTPLKLAIIANNIEVVEYLLSKSQDPNNDSLLMQGAVANGQMEIVKLLLRYGADPNLKDSGRHTPLMSAVGHTEIFQLLLSHDADINAKDNYDRTILIWAAQHGSYEVVEILLESGIDYTTKDKDGNSAGVIAESSGRVDISNLINNYTKIEGKQPYRDRDGHR